MDKTNATTSSTPGKSKPPKKRNSEVRKEQNRIASRAYREKRKQKLALLDEILKTDSQTDSMSSVSDETEGYTTSWSFQSRQASNSPIPAALTTVPVTTQWQAPSPSMASSVPAFGQESYDGWMNSFSHSNDAFPASTDYTHPFIPTDVREHTLGASTSYPMQTIPSITSTPSTPPVPSIPLDPSLVANHYTPQTQPVQSQHILHSSNPTHDNDEIQRQLWVASLENNTLVALERFSGLNHIQQEQVLDLVRKRRGLLQNTTSHQNLEFNYPTCQATPPPTHYVSTDFRKYQTMRQASKSPIPHGHH
ncbi:uncharacterized protein F4822DRAFT_68906 [Hypoxylon trugodes]|uniref:uncharacterized protein n=1 Tax=Hypoxylon trugodes TaxID=326681 RepID=UPI002198F856|nr:uncharacterized protein F4822DRAFT_68906 [Hypoxylon trugodes]KAI1383215.1 hypothetical protein F4822DRAFT_68906 [Hypoxylon trugodes]